MVVYWKGKISLAQKGFCLNRQGLCLEISEATNYAYALLSTLLRKSSKRAITSDAVKETKKYTAPSNNPTKPVERGASGVPPPIKIISAETTPTAREIQANTLNIFEASPRNLYLSAI
jgi:hypothetical protein|tara:strand:+ start:318 stop:671 length:354 start_codon:yes stop_codon:yes gene_type:complete